jgi:hypothetical protein
MVEPARVPLMPMFMFMFMFMPCALGVCGAPPPPPPALAILGFFRPDGEPSLSASPSASSGDRRFVARPPVTVADGMPGTFIPVWWGVCG